MTNDEIVEFRAGPELDALVAERVMGWRWLMDNFHGPYRACIWSADVAEKKLQQGWLPSTTIRRYSDWMVGLPKYSADIAEAWQVVEEMHRRGNVLSLDYLQDIGPLYWAAEFRLSGTHAEGETAPLAICRAALAALRA